ncbi:MAG TPA: hypothetical protein VK921_06235 [Anditalea sp.]|nr:hypothetical protein [Anditalea sp.]
MKSKIFICIILLFGCTKCQPKVEPEIDLKVEGTWFQSTVIYNTNYILRKEISFKNDGTYELTSKIIDKHTKGDIEYFVLYTGHYQVNGNRLKRSMVNEYGRMDVSARYNREDLVLKGSFSELPIVLLSLDEKEEQLTMDYRSGDCSNILNNNCIEVETYIKDK